MLIEKYSINLENYENSDDASVTLICHEKSPEMCQKAWPLVFVIPGGGYGFVSDREADPIASSFYAAGFNVSILKYSVAPFSYPVPYLEAFTALKLIKANAERFNIDADKISVCGFSAGGHLAGMMGTGFNDPLILNELKVKKDELKIQGMILSYPVITGGEFAHRGSFDNLLAENKNDKEWLDKVSIDKRVREDTPKTFLWSTFTDNLVPVENTLMMADALKKKNVQFEMHIFPIGCHGLSLANDLTKDASGNCFEPYVEKWMPMCVEWLRLLFK